MRTILAFVLALTSTIALVDPALACNDSTVRGEVLGVAPDGGWVYMVTSSGGGGDGGPYTTLMLYAADGTIIAQRTLCDGDECTNPCEPSDEPGRACHGKAPLAPFVGERAAAALGHTFKRALVGRIQRHLKLTPLRLGTARLKADQVETDDDSEWSPLCSVVWAPTVDGRVEVLALTVDETDIRCPAVDAKLYEHSRAAFRFVRIEHGLTADCGTDRDSYVWFPRDRIKTMRLMARAQKLAPRARVPLLREVVSAEPAYVPARIALAKALHDAEVPWPTAVAAMNVPWAEHTWSGYIQDFVDAVSGESFARWHGDALDAWLAALPTP